MASRASGSRDVNVTVSGPGYDKERLPTVGAGISTALSAASRGKKDGTWYVRENGNARYAVDRRGDHIYVTAANGD